MRPIKFRGKRVDTGKWVYGSYHKHIDITPGPLVGRIDDIHVHHLIIKDGFSDWNMPRGMEDIKVIPETVGQFTGLYDCEKKEIYEDDILSIAGMYYQIIFHDGCFGFKNVWGQFLSISQSALLRSKVMGNVHDNPELLEGGEK